MSVWLDIADVIIEQNSYLIKILSLIYYIYSNLKVVGLFK